MKYNYLVIEFHDNDFANDFRKGLEKFYKDCKDNGLFKGKIDAAERLESINNAGLLH